jgi:hypothetical protein
MVGYLSELFLAGGKAGLAIEPLKGVRRASDLTVVGSGLSSTLKYGINGDEKLASYIDTGIWPTAYPGCTLNGCSLWAYVTSNLPGGYQICGAVGTGGNKPFMLRPSSGFRGGFWPCANQVLLGGAVSEGFSGGCRLDAFSGYTIKSGVVSTWAIAAQSAPTTNFVLNSAEPGAAESPETWNLIGIGGGMPVDIALAMNEDWDQFQVDIGIFDDIQVPDEVPGPNCFGKFSYLQVKPLGASKIVRQINFPVSNTVDKETYNFFPITHAVGRPHIQTNRNAALITANPLSLTNGTNLITVTDPGHGASPDDTVKIIGVPGAPNDLINGMPLHEINHWHRIYSVTTDTYTIRGVTAATSTGSVGGTGVTVSMIKLKPVVSTFTPPHDGVFFVWQWSNRGEYNIVDGAEVFSGIDKANDLNPNFLLGNDPLTGLPNVLTGLQCRPAYHLTSEAAGAMLVNTAWKGRYAARNEPRDPLGQGYLDIAEAYGLDPAKVLPWWYFSENRQEVFTQAVAGYAVCYGYVALDPIPLIDITSFERLGVMMDQEHADRRDPDLWERDLKRWAQICKACGFYTGWLGHYMEGDTAQIQGFTPGPSGNAPRIINDPDIDFVNIISANQAIDHVVHLDMQFDYFKDVNGNVPINKIMLSETLGIGTSQVTLENAERVRAWADGKGISCFHIRRSASNEGGPIDLYRNQQMIRYLPDLSDTPPPASQGVIDAWITALAQDGYDVSLDEQSYRTSFVDALFNTAIWDKLDWVSISGEIPQQQLKCMKRLVSGTLVGTPTPTFVPHVGFTFDGAQNAVMSGFLPNGVGQVMTGTDIMVSDYEETNLATNTTSVGGYDDIVGQGLSLRNRGTTDDMRGQANSDFNTFMGVTDSRGLCYIQRSSAGVWSFGRKGSQLGTFVPGSSADVLPTRELAIGASNAAGTLNNFRAATISAVFAGRSLTAGEWLVVAQAYDNYRLASRGQMFLNQFWRDEGLWDDPYVWQD